MKIIVSRYFVPLLVALFAVLVPSCIADDFTTSPTDVLTFSRDTVSFDTVFTDQGTTTARLIVRNPAKKSVNISYIGFSDPQTRFRLNVDGFSASTFSDIEIRGGDSIYVFIECYPKTAPSSEPMLLEDKLDFITNGVTQQVVVQAWGQNVTRLKGERITADTELRPEQPYVVYDSLVVDKGATLRIRPGVKLLFHDGASLIVHGTLKATGDRLNFIDMRGDRQDNVLPGISYDIMAGQWKGIRFTESSKDNRLEFVNMRSTSAGITVDSCASSGKEAKLTMINSWLHNSQSNVLQSRHARVDAYGCVFSEAANAVVSLTGGVHNFVQCTIANNYLFSAISEPLLCLYYLLPDDWNGTDALMKASFDNCIIYGLAADLNIGDLTGSEVYLRNVLLKSNGEDDANFINCVWGADPLFYTVRSDYYFNYRLRPESPAIGMGNAAYVGKICLYDMDGLNRLAAGAPDLGAYVYVAPPDEE